MKHLRRAFGSFSQVEEGVCRVASRLPGLPKEQVVLTRLYRHIAKSLSDMANEVLRPFNLNEVSFSALVMAFGSVDNAINPSHLCEVTGESRTNMTRIMDDLEARGLVKRFPSADDRRRVILRLTRKGENLLKKIVPLMWKNQKNIYANFRVGEMKRLQELLKKQLATIEATLKRDF